ncbi:hypothetical protein RHMOL_Rhmol10G0157000 [Rhododendron molle]|uniref:Uncharacterized protein n=1 Tax=Rhododendron molle TaxID=49168 RepID=A0ACC0M3U1_RHOML|nr:hypothetical protein RHMOL_Rhmol10G0157000 [Rhododendron molle]
MVKDAELEPNNEKEKKLLHFLEQIENESDVMVDDTRECSLDHDGSKSEKDEGVEETNNDMNNLISDLLKEIDRLKEESKEKDRVIQTLQQKIVELERDHVPYQEATEQMFDYETEVGTVHVEKGILQEEIVQKEVEIGEEDKEKRQEEEESNEGGVDQTISERVEIPTGLHDEILSDDVVDKTICQIFKDTQEGERKEEKKRKREQDDIDPPSMVKDLLDKEEDKEKRQEEEESKEGGVDRIISERVEIATGLHDEILSDEVFDKTICQIFKDT